MGHQFNEVNVQAHSSWLLLDPVLLLVAQMPEVAKDVCYQLCLLSQLYSIKKKEHSSVTRLWFHAETVAKSALFSLSRVI